MSAANFGAEMSTKILCGNNSGMFSERGVYSPNMWPTPFLWKTTLGLKIREIEDVVVFCCAAPPHVGSNQTT